MSEATWFGRAFCTVGAVREEFRSGHRGAVFSFACRAPTVLDCVAMVREEAVENSLDLKGFEFIMQKDYMDREPSGYEQELEERLGEYPVQFKNVHFFMPDT